MQFVNAFVLQLANELKTFVSDRKLYDGTRVVKDRINVMYPTIYPAKPRDIKIPRYCTDRFAKSWNILEFRAGIVLRKRVYCAWNEALAVVLNFTKYTGDILIPLLSSSRHEHISGGIWDIMGWLSLYRITTESLNYLARGRLWDSSLSIHNLYIHLELVYKSSKKI